MNISRSATRLLTRKPNVSRISTRTMASPSTNTDTSATPRPKKEWLIILPDHPGTLEKRFEVRPDHLSDLKPHVDNGTFTLGGAFFDDHPPEGQTPLVKGSVMIAEAESKEEVWEMVRRDVYARRGVWDLSQVQVWGWRSALRRGMQGGL